MHISVTAMAADIAVMSLSVATASIQSDVTIAVTQM